MGRPCEAALVPMFNVGLPGLAGWVRQGKAALAERVGLAIKQTEGQDGSGLAACMLITVAVMIQYGLRRCVVVYRISMMMMMAAGQQHAIPSRHEMDEMEHVWRMAWPDCQS